MAKEIPVGSALYALHNKYTCFEGRDGKLLKTGDHMTIVPADLQVPGRIKNNAQNNRMTMSPAPLAVKLCTVLGVDKSTTPKTVYGAIQLAKKKINFCTNGTTVQVDSPEQDGDNERLLGVLPVVVWFEDQDPDMCKYRDKVARSEDTEIDCWRYSDAFYYEYAFTHKSIELEYNATIVIPTIKKTERKVRKRKASSHSVLPWKDSALSKVSNDCSVASALQGKYLLPIQWGIVEEDGVQYDLSQDVVPLSFLEGYVDNSAFRSVLREMVGSIGALFRANDVDDSDTSKSFGDLVAEATKSVNSTLRNKLLVGEPGTGKTMLVQAVAAALGLPCIIIRLSALSEMDVITEEVRVTDSGFKSVKSKCYWLTKYGGLVCFDDMTNADPNTFFAALGGALESPFQLQVGQKFIKRHPLTFMFATANVGTEGSRSINEALLTRFPNVAYVTKLDDKAFKECIASRALRGTGADISDVDLSIIVNWAFETYTSVLTMIKMHNADIAERLITLRAPIALTETLLNDYTEGFALNPVGLAIEVFANILYAAGEPELREVAAKAIESSSVREFSSIGK